MTSVIEPDSVIDETEGDTTVPIEKYAISSFGIDFDVEGLVRRLRKKELYVPDFQRNFVWSRAEASQFIESLLLGLPVPGVFLAKEHDSQKLMIIDGQQRLMSLLFFYDGYFKPYESQTSKSIFALTKVQPQFDERIYDSLEEDDRIRLDNSVIHATILKQDTPVEDADSSLYYVFGRLNSGGRKVTPQEIRTAVFNGPLIETIRTLNKDPAWRKIFGPENPRLKDEELILRFLALREGVESYERPMEEFINKFCRRHRRPKAPFVKEVSESFKKTCSVALSVLGEKAFRPKRSLNAAVFDSVFFGLDKRLKKGEIKEPEELKSAHARLVENESYVASTSRATADESNVQMRLRLAAEAFAEVP